MANWARPSLPVRFRSSQSLHKPAAERKTKAVYLPVPFDCHTYICTCTGKGDSHGGRARGIMLGPAASRAKSLEFPMLISVSCASRC